MPEINPREKLANWLFKIKFLKEQIDKLEFLNEFPILCISTFLPKSQVVEFTLKKLLFKLEFDLYTECKTAFIKKKLRYPKEFDGLTLGQLVKEVQKYEGDKEFERFKQKLVKLKNIRNQLTHRLFDSNNDIKNLIQVASEGVIIVNEVNDMLGKILNYEPSIVGQK